MRYWRQWANETLGNPPEITRGFYGRSLVSLGWASPSSVILFPFSSLTLLVGWQEGHPACIKCWVNPSLRTGLRTPLRTFVEERILLHTLHTWWYVGGWRFDWNFARFIAPVVTITSIILSCNKILNGDILVPDNPGPPGIMAIKMESSRVLVLNAATDGVTVRILVVKKFDYVVTQYQSVTDRQMNRWSPISVFVCVLCARACRTECQSLECQAPIS